MKAMDKRTKFIEKLGLNHDPFETPVAEQELKRVQDLFYSYFSPQSSSTFQEELLQNLRRPQHACIFGNPGDGKSTLRLNLEADCRTVLDGTLTITYILGEDIERQLSFEEHGVSLAQSLMIDLTLAIVEQVNSTPTPSEKQVKSLREQIQIGGRRLNRLLRILSDKINIHDESALDPVWGLGRDWHLISKAPVKYVGTSEELKTLLKDLTVPVKQKKTASWESFWQGIQLAQGWGYKRFFILIDGVDTKQRTPQAMMNLITPLLNTLAEMGAKDVFFKFFLPLELEKSAKAHISSLGRDLYSQVFFSIMEWDDAGLRQLLAQRFRAAMSRSGPIYTGLNSLATPNLNLDEQLIHAAEGSPRRLLGLISELIDVHLARDPDSFHLNQEDWDTYQQKLAKNQPAHTTKKNGIHAKRQTKASKHLCDP